MFPILFQAGIFTLHTYGLLVALGLLAGLKIILLIYRASAEYKQKQEEALQQMFLFALFSGIIFARLFYVVVFWDQFSESPIEIFKIWQGGLIFYGGFFGAGLALWLWTKWKKTFQFLTVLDWSVPGLLIGHALGRLGCFFAGCCYGKETSSTWGIVFTHAESLAPRYVFLHPTQLYEFTFLLVLTKIFFTRAKKQAANLNLKPGTLFYQYVILYALGRLVIEFFRADAPWIFGLSCGQVVSIFALILGLICYKFNSTKLGKN